MAWNGRWGEFLHQLNMAITTALQGLTFCYSAPPRSNSYYPITENDYCTSRTTEPTDF